MSAPQRIASLREGHSAAPMLSRSASSVTSGGLGARGGAVAAILPHSDTDDTEGFASQPRSPVLERDRLALEVALLRPPASRAVATPVGPAAIAKWSAVQREIALLLEGRSPRTRARVEQSVASFEQCLKAEAEEGGGLVSNTRKSTSRSASLEPQSWQQRPTRSSGGASSQTTATSTAAAASRAAGSFAANNSSSMCSQLGVGLLAASSTADASLSLLRYPGVQAALSGGKACHTQLFAGGVVHVAADAITNIVVCPWALDWRRVLFPDAEADGAASRFATGAPFIAATLGGQMLFGRSTGVGGPCDGATQRIVGALGSAGSGSILDVSCKFDTPGVFLTCGGDGAAQLWSLPSSEDLDEGGEAGGLAAASFMPPTSATSDGRNPNDDSMQGASSVRDGPWSSSRDEQDRGESVALASMILDGSDSPRSSLLDDDDDAGLLWESSTASEASSIVDPTDPPPMPRQSAPSAAAASLLRSPTLRAAPGTAPPTVVSSAVGTQKFGKTTLVRVPNDVMTAVCWLTVSSMRDYAVCGTRAGRLLTLSAHRDVPLSDVRLQSATSVTCVAVASAASSGGGATHSACTTSNGQLHILDHRLGSGIGAATPLQSVHFGSLAVSAKKKRAVSCCFVDIGGTASGNYIATADEGHKLRLFDVRNLRDAPTYIEFPTSLGRISAVSVPSLPNSCIVAVPQHGDCVSIVDVVSMSVLAEARRLHGGKMVACAAASHLATIPPVGVGASGGAGGEVIQVLSGGVTGQLSEAHFCVPFPP